MKSEDNIYKAGETVITIDRKNKGIVVEDNYKLPGDPGDICVNWENGQKVSYNKEWLDKNVVIIYSLS